MAEGAGTVVALVVALAIAGLITIVGIILLMMWLQPDIEHKPSELLSHPTLQRAVYHASIAESGP